MYKPVFLGQGAISSLLAAQCQQHGITYAVMGRTQQLSEIHYTQPEYSASFTPPGIDKTQLSAEHLLVLPIKAYQVELALEQLRSYLQKHRTPVLLFHNGMGNIEISKKLLPDNPILAGTTNYAALKQSDNSVVQTGIGDTNIGWVQQENKDLKTWLQQDFSSLLPPVHWCENIETALWQKLSINAVINPITAIEQVQNGKLSQPSYQPLIHALCEEIATVMRGSGIQVSTEELTNKIQQVCSATAENYSSMNRDIFYQRKTEIDFINGYIQQQAQKLGIAVPKNQMLLEQVKLLEHTDSSTQD